MKFSLTITLSEEKKRYIVQWKVVKLKGRETWKIHFYITFFPAGINIYADRGFTSINAQ